MCYHLNMKQKIVIVLLIGSVVLNGYFLSEINSYKWELELIERFPDMELSSIMFDLYGDGYYGDITGFVAFEDITQQPSQFRQYYRIEATDKRDTDGSQIFTFTQIFVDSPYARTVGDPEEIAVTEYKDDYLLFDLGDGVNFVRLNIVPFAIRGEGYRKVNSIDFLVDDHVEASLITSDQEFSSFVKSLQ